MTALVEINKREEARVAKVDMDQDRHVLAAALSADADVLLTGTSAICQSWMAQGRPPGRRRNPPARHLASAIPTAFATLAGWASPASTDIRKSLILANITNPPSRGNCPKPSAEAKTNS